jgi:hypothetical protein
MRRVLVLALVVLALGALASVASAGPTGSILPPANMMREPGGSVTLGK